MIVQVFQYTYQDNGTTERVHVADVSAPDELAETAACEYAFRYTQNLAGSWSRGPRLEDGASNFDYNPAVEVVSPLHEINGQIYGLRSSMAGDDFVVNGHIYRCEMIGFNFVGNV